MASLRWLVVGHAPGPLPGQDQCVGHDSLSVAWRPLGLIAASIAATQYGGTLYLVAAGEDGQVFHTRQTG